MARKTSTAVIQPNLGLRFDKPSIALDPRELSDGLNFRVKEGELNNLNLGWDRFSTFQLNGAVRLITSFLISDGTEHLVFATDTDLYRYDAGTDTAKFITPAYVTGTLEVEGSSVSTAGGTNLGDLTGAGGLAASFDGTTAQAAAACSTKAAATFGYVGKTLATPSKISKAIVYGSNDAGFVSAINPTVTLDLYGKNGTAPANSTDGTLLGTASFTDTADESAGRTVTSANTTTWDHVWVRISHNGAANQINSAEVKLYSRTGTNVIGSGTDWSPTNAKTGDFLYVGSATQTDPAATWVEIATVNSDTSITLLTAAATAAAGTAYTLRRVFTGDADDVWTYATFVNAGGVEDRFYISNGVEELCYWNGLTDFVTRLDAFTLKKIKAIAVSNNMMLYGNFERSGTHFPTSIVNSALGDPEDITTGLSSEFVAHSATDPIRSIYPLADNFVIYSTRVLVIAQFVGDPLVFTFRTASNGVGPLSPNSIADFGDYHFFIGFDSAYKFDGVTLQTEGQHVWREVIRRNDPLRRSACFAHFDEENGDLIVVIALTSDAGAGTAGSAPERAFSMHYLEDVGPQDPQPWSQREFPFTAAGYFSRQTGLTWNEISETWEQLNFRWNDQFFFAAFPLSLVGDADGKIYTLGTSQNKEGGAGLASYVKFARRALGDGRMRGMVRRVYPFGHQFANDLDVTVYLMDHAMGSPTITDTQAWDQSIPQEGHFTSHFRRGRFMEVRFGTDGPSQPWQIAGYDVDVVKGGFR